ncbi:MAG: hypothetical protein OXF74_08735, partial [Rhodobacteraceae bacterium]|nr:hypothetical protein [Paracoccaceae bacterium]
YVSMDNHTLTIGDNDAADLVAGGIKDVGFDDIGADDEPEMLNGNSAASLIYTGSFGPASVAISAGADGAGGHDYAAGFNFNIAPVKVGVGFDSNKVMSVGMGISQGAISGNVLYSTTKKHMVMVARPTDLSDDDTVNPTAPTAVAAATLATYFRAPANAPGADITAGPGWSHRTMEGVKSTALGIDISYQLSEGTSVTMVYGQHKVDGYDLTPTVDEDSTGDNKSAIIASETKKSMGIGFSHDLGGGATLKAGAGKNGDENTVADLGITMSF